MPLPVRITVLILRMLPTTRTCLHRHQWKLLCHKTKLVLKKHLHNNHSLMSKIFRDNFLTI